MPCLRPYCHPGWALDIETSGPASLRALYTRGRTLFNHQQQACEVLGFAWMTERPRHALVPALPELAVERAGQALRTPDR